MTEQVAKEHLKRLIDNVERYEDEKKEISNQISDIYKEAKALGFNVKIMKKIISIRKKDQDEVQEEDMLLEKYIDALGM